MSKKIKQNKKEYYFLFEFSSIEPCFQDEAYNSKYNLMLKKPKKEKSVDIVSSNFFLWGFHDILRIFVSEDIQIFHELQKIEPLNNILDLKYCAGFSNINKPFNLQKIIHDYPLIGISCLKFKDKLFKNIKTNKFTPFVFSFLKDRINKALGNKKECCVYPIISYGWEDVILLFFSKSYDLIKKTILEIREIEFSDISKEFWEKNYSDKGKQSFRHIFLNTFTTFGAYFPNSHLKNRSYSIDKLRKNIKKQDSMKINGIKLQISPGHIKQAEKELIKKFKDVNLEEQIEIKPIPQRGDLFLSFNEKSNFYEFMPFFLTMLDVMSKKDTCIVSSETEFIMESEWLQTLKNDVKGGIKGKRKEIIGKQEKELVKWLQNKKIFEEHSLFGFINLLKNASFFENHYFVSQSMTSWINTVNVFKRYLFYIKNNWTKIKKETNREKLEFFLNMLYMNLEKLILHLSNTFSDRFRGIYPVGETSVTPLITYKNSLQKLFICIDYICIKIFKDINCLLGMKINYPEDFSFCSTFTTDFSPAIDPLPWDTYFVFIPDFFSVNLIYLPHEIGHAFFQYFPDEEKTISTLKKITMDFDAKFYTSIDYGRSIIEEILADYFALCAGFNNDFKKFKIMYDLFPLETENIEHSIRRKGVKWLYNNISKSSYSILPFNKEYFDELNEALSLILRGKNSLKNCLIKLRDNNNSSVSFSYLNLFARENWIELFLNFFKES